MSESKSEESSITEDLIDPTHYNIMGHPYSKDNSEYLEKIKKEFNYHTEEWGTLNQFNKAGRRIMKGEKANGKIMICLDYGDLEWKSVKLFNSDQTELLFKK